MNEDMEIPFEGMSPQDINKMISSMLSNAKPETFKERLAIWGIKFVLFLERAKAWVKTLPKKLRMLWDRFKTLMAHLLRLEVNNAPQCA